MLCPPPGQSNDFFTVKSFFWGVLEFSLRGSESTITRQSAFTFTQAALEHSACAQADQSLLLVLALVPTRKVPDDVRHSRKLLMHSSRYLSCETLESTLPVHKQTFCRTFREPRVMDTTPATTRLHLRMAHTVGSVTGDLYPLTHHAADHRNASGRV
jgi:hypothetical protein